MQPATGATAAYWRIKAGFEGFGPTSRILGHSAKEVTPILGNIPGGLELLPNKLHRSNSGSTGWLTITGYGSTISKPRSGDPYKEIYRIPAVVRPKQGEKSSTNDYWALVDPDLLDPPNTQIAAPPANGHDALDEDNPRLYSPWNQYLQVLSRAEAFHDALQNQAHDQTYCFRGVGHSTADVIELACETSWFNMESYPSRGFRGFFTDKNGKSWKAVLQNFTGGGDGTVPEHSAAGATLSPPGKPVPGQPNPADFKIEHQPAYEDSAAQTFTEKAIITLCKRRYELFRNLVGDFTSPGPTRYA